MSNVGWYHAQNGQQVGPMSLHELVQRIGAVAGPRTLVFGPGMTNWQEASTVPAVAQLLQPGVARGAGFPPPPPSGRRSDQIDYEIFGTEMQYVEITLDPGEMAIAEPGSFFFMTPGVKLETRFGDPSAEAGGFFSKLMTAGKRALTGESLFMSTYQNVGGGREVGAFAAPYPGKIIPMHLDQLGGELIAQKDSFLAAARGVQVGIAFQKKIGVALFGGEGFIMQRLTGDGVALVHAGGTMLKKTLAPGQTLRVDTGCLVALMPSVQYNIEFVGGVKTALFGGEGLFYATLTGPGDVWLQSLPFSRLAGRMAASVRSGKEEGSVLGGLGRVLDGDNS
jgi:uncharacterized protein (TIGR00266 family)